MEFENFMNTSKAKAIIIAAGLDSQLKSHTEDLPKCVLKLHHTHCCLKTPSIDPI